MDGDLWVSLDSNRTLWLTEVSKKTFESQSPFYLENDSGIFVVLEDLALGTFDILAKAASIPSGLKLLSLFQESLLEKPGGRPHLEAVQA